MNRLTEKVLFEKLQQGDQKVLKNFFDDTFALFVAFAQDFLGEMMLVRILYRILLLLFGSRKSPLKISTM